MLPVIIAAIMSLNLGVIELIPWKDQPPHEPSNNNVADIAYRGTVIGVTKSSITVQYPHKATPAKTFPVSETLSAGEIPMHPRILQTSRGPLDYTVDPWKMYRLTDVKVGDWVNVFYSRINGVDTCDHINIAKRPGGLVPPLPDEAEELAKPSLPPPGLKRGPNAPPSLRDRYIPYHEGANAYWDLVDRGISYPAKFGDHRRFAVAPPPRPAKP